MQRGSGVPGCRGLGRAVAFLLAAVTMAGCPSAPPPATTAFAEETPAFTATADQTPLPELSEEATLREYLVCAALNNPGLEAAFNRWKAALERVPQARSLADPRFTYRYFIEEIETRVGPQRQGVSLSQTFPWFGKLELRGDVAMEAANAARKRYETERLKVFYRVKAAYYEYYYLAQVTGVVGENRDLMQHLEEVARARYRVAAARHPDVIRAQVELGKLEDRLRTLTDIRGAVVARLNAELNRPAEAGLPWPKSIPEESIDATDEQLLGWLREASPELEELDHEIAKERHAIDLAKKEYFPDFTFGLDYVETDGAVMPGVRDSGQDAVSATVSVNVPIWFERYRAGEREARARHQAALKARLALENSLSATVKQAVYWFRDAERKTGLYRDALIPRAEESLKSLEAAFRGGTASFLDLVDAQRVLLEFELTLQRALVDRAIRLAELDMLVGRDLPRTLPKEGRTPVP